mgnify:CR=1 FL=1
MNNNKMNKMNKNKKQCNDQLIIKELTVKLHKQNMINEDNIELIEQLKSEIAIMNCEICSIKKIPEEDWGLSKEELEDKVNYLEKRIDDLEDDIREKNKKIKKKKEKIKELYHDNEKLNDKIDFVRDLI